MSDRLTVEIECPSLGSSGCPSINSSFSPLESPTPTPTSSIFSQGSLASPLWPEGGPYGGHGYERRSAGTPLRSSFRLVDFAGHDGMPMGCGSLDSQDRMSVPDYLSAYDENAEQFWIPSELPKSYEAAGMPFPPQMTPYQHMARNYYRPPQHAYLPESASNPCLSRPMFTQADRMPSSVSMNNVLQWMPSTESISPQTITPSQAFGHGPVTPPPSYSEFPASLHTFKQNHTPNTPVRRCSLENPSGTNTPLSRVSGGGMDFHEDFQLSPAYREVSSSSGVVGSHRPQRQLSKRMPKKQLSKQSLTLENLPPIIKQVQFKCKEPGCKGRFKRQEHLKRHMKSHSKEKPHVCWVPGCHRAFSRSDNLNAHYTKTHSKRGGRNRYVATLDETSPDYDPDFRGQLTPDGRPIYGSKLEDMSLEVDDMGIDCWDQ